MLTETLKTFFVWSFILPSAYCLGSIYRTVIPAQSPFRRGIFFYALGLATLSYGVVILSAAHILAPIFIWGLILIPLILGFRILPEWVEWLRELVRVIRPSRGAVSWIFFGLFAVSFGCLLIGTLTPEIGGDALCYQLALPKMFLAKGSLTPDFLNHNSFFPLLMNNLYLVGLATGGVLAAKLFHFFCGLLLVLAVLDLVAERTRSRTLAYFSALAVWTTPAVYNMLSTTYIDVAVAFYIFLAVMAFVDAWETGDHKEFFLAGLFAGCSIATKYLSLVGLTALVPMCLFFGIKTRQWRRLLVCLYLVALGIFIASGYWIIRNWIATGNPFFPYFGALFGVIDRPPIDFHTRFGFGHSWFSFASLYFNMFLTPDSFGAHSTRIGIFYFLFVPFALLALLFSPKSRPYAFFSLSFTGVIFFMAQMDRWILPVLPVLAVSSAGGISWLYGYASTGLKTVLRRTGVALGILILAAYVLAGVYHYRYAYQLFIGKWTLKTYLLNLERTTPIADWANEHLPQNAKLLVDFESRLFYFDRPVVRLPFMEWRHASSNLRADPGVFIALLQKEGITHVLISEEVRVNSAVSGSSSGLQEMLASGGFKELYAAFSQNIRDARYFYRIYEVPEQHG